MVAVIGGNAVVTRGNGETKLMPPPVTPPSRPESVPGAAVVTLGAAVVTLGVAVATIDPGAPVLAASAN